MAPAAGPRPARWRALCAVRCEGRAPSTRDLRCATTRTTATRVQLRADAADTECGSVRNDKQGRGRPRCVCGCRGGNLSAGGLEPRSQRSYLGRALPHPLLFSSFASRRLALKALL